MNENVGKGGVHGGCPTAVVLVDIEPMASDDIFWGVKGVEFTEMKNAREPYAQPSATLEVRL